MNIGTIVDAPVLKVRLHRRPRRLRPHPGRESRNTSPDMLTARRQLRVRRAAAALPADARRLSVEVARRAARATRSSPPTPGASQPLDHQPRQPRAGHDLHDPAHVGRATQSHGAGLAAPCNENCVRELPGRGRPADRDVPARQSGGGTLVAYCFEGRNAHQTLGMLMTRNEWSAPATCRWVSSPPTTRLACGPLQDRPAGPRLPCSTRTCWATTWRNGSPTARMLKRTFRNVAVIAGLIQRNQPGAENSAAAKSPSTAT